MWCLVIFSILSSRYSKIIQVKKKWAISETAKLAASGCSHPRRKRAEGWRLFPPGGASHSFPVASRDKWHHGRRAGRHTNLARATGRTGAAATAATSLPGRVRKPRKHAERVWRSVRLHTVHAFRTLYVSSRPRAPAHCSHERARLRKELSILWTWRQLGSTQYTWNQYEKVILSGLVNGPWHSRSPFIALWISGLISLCSDRSVPWNTIERSQKRFQHLLHTHYGQLPSPQNTKLSNTHYHLQGLQKYTNCIKSFWKRNL